MPTIDLSTFIAAPIDQVFDLARSIDLHVKSAARTGEQAIAGVRTGLIGANEEVTWRARHFGVWQTLSVRITEFDAPSHFTDTMLHGPFHSMVHHHDFEAVQGGTVMRDRFTYESPCGYFGQLADFLFLARYMKSFLLKRNLVIKEAAESGETPLLR